MFSWRSFVFNMLLIKTSFIFWLKGRPLHFWLLGALLLVFFLSFSTFVGFPFGTEPPAVSSPVVTQGDLEPTDYCSLSRVPHSWDNVTVVVEGPGRGRIFSKILGEGELSVVRMPNNVIVTTDERMVEMLRMLEQSDGYISTDNAAVLLRSKEYEGLENRPGGVFQHFAPEEEGSQRSPYFWPVVAVAFVGTFLLLTWLDGNLRFPRRPWNDPTQPR